LLLLDLDNFKQVNERHGHLYGSHLLAGVGTAIGSAIRAEDTLGRPGISAEELLHAADQALSAARSEAGRP
jgi:predicted signal transduction protein with EAL and GGDEF domain